MLSNTNNTQLNLNACDGNNLALHLNTESIQNPVIITPSTKHYSWPKAAALCGYGYNSISDIYVDAARGGYMLSMIRNDYRLHSLVQLFKNRPNDNLSHSH